MNRFHWHTFHRFTEEDLIAYHLGELAPRRARKLELALTADATLAAESAAILATLNAFPRDEAGPVLNADDLDRHWGALQPRLPVRVSPAPMLRKGHQGWVRPLLVTGGAAAVLAVGVLIVAHHAKRQPAESGMGVARKPALESQQPAQSYPQQATSYPQPATNGGTGTERAGGQQLIRPFARSAGVSPVVRTPMEPASGVNSLKQQPAQTATTSTTTTVPAPAPPSKEPSPGEAPEMAMSHVPSQPPSASSVSMPRETAAITGKTHHGPHSSPTVDLTLGIFGNVIAGRSFNTAATGGTGEDFHAVGATPAVGALASFHQQFSPRAGYRVTGAYSRPSLDYTYKPASTPNAQPSTIEITTRAVELSGAYVVQGPHGRRIHTYAEAGGGVMLFHPYQSGTTPSTGVRPMGTGGVGAELEVTRRMSVHVQYRALVFETPDFHTTNAAVPIISSVVVSSQPSVGITLHLGKSPSN